MAHKYKQVADALRADILDGVYQKRMLLPIRTAAVPALQRQPANRSPGPLGTGVRGYDRTQAGQRLPHPSRSGKS